MYLRGKPSVHPMLLLAGERQDPPRAPRAIPPAGVRCRGAGVMMSGLSGRRVSGGGRIALRTHTRGKIMVNRGENDLFLLAQ